MQLTTTTLLRKLRECKTLRTLLQIHTTLIVTGLNFWDIKETTTKGSWMWRKILKYRAHAKVFHKIELGNGQVTSFWFGNWSSQGQMFDITGRRGFIDLGITRSSTMAEVFETHRRQRHRVDTLDSIEDAIEAAGVARKIGADCSCWKSDNNSYKRQFVTRHTMNLHRTRHPEVSWYKGIWFRYETPKYSFLSWLAVQDKLSTGDRVRSWGLARMVKCSLCNNVEESRTHLFFECCYSSEVWKQTMSKMLNSTFTCNWDQIVALINTSGPKYTTYVIRFAFQTTLYHIWRERNNRRHRKVAQPTSSLIKVINKTVVNRINSILAASDHEYRETMDLWLSTRQ